MSGATESIESRKVEVSKSFERKVELTEKVSAVMRMFGVSMDRLSREPISHECNFEVRAGDIVYITGPSGSGKSVILREVERQIPADQRINLSQIELCGDMSLVDCFEGDLISRLGFLSTAGLNDVFTILNQPANLSEGQQYRYRLARAIASGRRYIFADEYCSNLDGVTSAVISYNLRRYADRKRVTFFLAGVRDKDIGDLRPDVVVVKDFGVKGEVIYREGRS